MNKEQIAHDLTLFTMNNSHRISSDDNDIDYTILSPNELVQAYNKLYNEFLNLL